MSDESKKIWGWGGGGPDRGALTDLPFVWIRISAPARSHFQLGGGGRQPEICFSSQSSVNLRQENTELDRTQNFKMDNNAKVDNFM